MKKLMMLVCLLGMTAVAYAESPAVAVRIMDPNFGGNIERANAKSAKEYQQQQATRFLLPKQPKLEGNSSEEAIDAATKQFEAAQQQLKSLAIAFHIYAAELEKIQEIHRDLFSGFNTSKPNAAHWPEDEEWEVAFRVQGAGKALDEQLNKIDNRILVRIIKKTLCHQYLVRGQLYFLPFALHMIDGDPHDRGAYLEEMYKEYVLYHQATRKVGYNK